jgi:hypothetical protein
MFDGSCMMDPNATGSLRAAGGPNLAVAKAHDRKDDRKDREDDDQ